VCWFCVDHHLWRGVRGGRGTRLGWFIIIFYKYVIRKKEASRSEEKKTLHNT
jgi:hypothetical protein